MISLSKKGVLFAILALGLAWFSFANAFANVFAARNPRLALSLDAGHPVAIIARVHNQLLVAGGESPVATQAEEAIRTSVRRLPINAPALELYGLLSGAAANDTRLRNNLYLADRFSRRDTGTQLWLIQDAVDHNDIATALHHYDVALRISLGNRSLLFPILTDAMNEPAIRKRFQPYLAAPPPWMESFLRYAVSNTQNPTDISHLATEGIGFPRGAAYNSLDTELIRQLIAHDDIEEAIAYLSRLDTFDTNILQSLAFTKQSTEQKLAPVAWQPYSIAGVFPSFVSGADGQLDLDIDLASGYNGPIARKLLALRPGRYKLEAQFSAEGTSEVSSIRWQIQCADQSSRGPFFSARSEMTRGFTIVETFEVPQDCPVQIVSLDTMAGFGLGGINLVMRSPRLSKVSMVH